MKYELLAREITSYAPNSVLNKQIQDAVGATSHREYAQILQKEGPSILYSLRNSKKCPVCGK
jgi:hypothetical protein